MLFSSLKEALQRLLNFTRDLLRKDARPSLTPEEDLALGTLRDFSPSSPSQISEVHFILYYVLMGYPWPKRVFVLHSGLLAVSNFYPLHSIFFISLLTPGSLFLILVWLPSLLFDQMPLLGVTQFWLL
jgi:hypothetical protein